VRTTSTAKAFPLRGVHAGQTATVVGRGPSLLKLTASDFKLSSSGPVLALNHAILTIRKLHLPNPLYSMQKDGCLVAPMPPETLILSQAQSGRCFADYAPRYVVDVRKLGLPVTAMSTSFAVAMAHVMGCSKVRMLACDAYTNGDFRTVVGDELQLIGRGYLHAAGQTMRLAKRLHMPIEWVAA
jgi:hypothetical protein